MPTNHDPKGLAPNKESPYCAFKDDRYRLLAIIARHVTSLGICAMVVFGPVATSKLPQLLALFRGG
jgi:hypothetical protein